LSFIELCKRVGGAVEERPRLGRVCVVKKPSQAIKLIAAAREEGVPSGAIAIEETGTELVFENRGEEIVVRGCAPVLGDGVWCNTFRISNPLDLVDLPIMHSLSNEAGEIVDTLTGEVLPEGELPYSVLYGVTPEAEAINQSGLETKTLAREVAASRGKIAEVVELYKQGVPVSEIMARTGIRSVSTIYRILEAAGVKKRRPGRKLVRRLTLREIQEICSAWESGETLSAIARRLGRNPSTIKYVIDRYCKKM